MNPFSGWIERDLPAVDTPFEGLEGRLLSSPHGQAVFFRAARDTEVPPHAHGSQWGVVVAGTLELTIGDDTRTYEPGETYDIPAGTTHAARLGAGCCVIDVFQDPDRYAPKQ